MARLTLDEVLARVYDSDDDSDDALGTGDFATNWHH